MKDSHTSDENDAELDQVAARIHPLPDDVTPSDRFLAEMRQRLLDLRQQSSKPSKAA